MENKFLSQRLKWAVERKQAETGKEITKSDLARVAGTSRTSATLWYKDTNGIGAEAARELARFLGVDAVWLETGEGEPEKNESRPMFSRSTSKREVHLDDTDEFIAIKRVDFKLSAGITGYSVEYLNGDKAPIIFRRDWVESSGYNPNALYAIKVSGQSMETSLYDNDLVVVNTNDTKIVDGEVFAVNYDGELVIKRLLRQVGQWHLSSDNPNKVRYPDKICHEECILIGRVIYKQSQRI